MKVCDMDYCSELVEDDEDYCLRCEKLMYDAAIERMEVFQ